MLSLNVDVDALNVPSGNRCSNCTYELNQEGIEVFDNLEKIEDSLTIDTKMALVHIAGYVTRKDQVLPEEELLDVTTFYHQRFGGYYSIILTN